MDNGTHYDKTIAMRSIEERVTALETSLLTMANAIYAMIQNNMGTELPKPPPRLPFEPMETPLLPPSSPALHFNLDPHQRAHWADVYSRLVVAGKLRSCEVSCTNFTYLLCGVGTPPLNPIRWYGSTRELAYAVRQYLGANWEVALAAFNDKNDRPLPKSFSHSKAPSAQSIQKIDYIFRNRD